MGRVRATSDGSSRQCRLSIKLMWPFARLLGSDDRTARILAGYGVRAEEFANPDFRVPHRALMEALEAKIDETGDPSIGLRAAEVIEPGDIDACEYACRCCSNLGEAIFTTVRYIKVMNEAAELTVSEDDERVVITYDVVDGVTQPPASIDFVLASMVQVDRRITGVDDSDCEAWFRHPEPSYVDAYERVLGPRRVRFEMPQNALVIPRARMAVPMLRADPRAARAFKLWAEQHLEKLRETSGTTGRVRELVVTHLASGHVTMAWVARHLGMSVPTLRRYLQAEGTTFSDIVDGHRRQVAEQKLREASMSISELAFVLGFSNVAAFYRAFKRYTGVSPAEYRARTRLR